MQKWKSPYWFVWCWSASDYNWNLHLPMHMALPAQKGATLHPEVLNQGLGGLGLHNQATCMAASLQ